MNPVILPAVYLARHGETAWSPTGQHTGLTDLPVTERGERNARRLKERLAGLVFAKVFTSRCSAPLAPATWLASGTQPKPIATWSNGTMANMKGCERRRFIRSVPTGNYSAMAAPTENRRTRLAFGPIAL
jgi:hypothetical protein